MKIRPFLSHRRKNATAVARLKQILELYGAGGWKDTDDLRMGASTEPEIRRAIFEQTSGFIWWGTTQALKSTIINELEIPAALDRAQTESLYPLVPLFIDLSPGRDHKEIEGALGERAGELLGRNGFIKGEGEPAENFRRRVAGRYVRDAVGFLPATPVTVSFRALSEPSGEHDLTFDWRSVFYARSRDLAVGSLPLLLDALSNAREAFQARESSPQLWLDLDLPLPLAFLVGFEWRITTRLRLHIKQRTGSSFAWVEADGPLSEAPSAIPRRFDRDGPVVVAVSCKDPLEEVAQSYAEEIQASELLILHVPGAIDECQMRALARRTADELGKLNDRSVDKHLLIRGPVALATMIGAASNACGPVTIPFWDGARYVAPIVAGGVH